MELDLNTEENLTIENVAKLLASKDDSQDRQLRVTSDGVAYLSDEVGNINTNGLLFRLETWDAGNGYVGAEAAKDEKWVKRIYECLSKQFPTPQSTYIDIF